MYYYNPYMPYMPYDMYRPDPNAAGPMYGMENYMPENFMPEYMPSGCMKPYFMEKIKEKKCVKVPEVIGRNYTQILLENEIPFAPGCPALEIKDIMKEVKELILSVCRDKVLINGKLHKNINYKTFENIGRIKCHCEDLDVIYGNVKHVSVSIPFSGYIDIPGARLGDTVEVEFAGVEDCCELDILKDPYYVRGCAVPVYKKLKEKVIVKIEVKVLRPCQITVDEERPNICP